MIDTLKKIFLFAKLPDMQLEILQSFCSTKELSKGEILFSEGQEATEFYYVIAGTMKLFKLSNDGNEVILHFQKENELIAEAIIFDFDTYPAFCQAIEDSSVLQIRKRDFLNFLAGSQTVMFEVMKAYSLRLRQLLAIIEELSLHSIKMRLANYLLNNMSVVDGNLMCYLNISKKDLSSRLGTIPETLSRTLKFLKQEGIITEDSDTIIIHDKKRLENLLN
ncbi:Crp/Fnr family transcriptional regulator [candidate division KSB1 bacterium]|nr:Crp/Fnr family transcriptional regulator [candidate division KSB1 bacterium]